MNSCIYSGNPTYAVV